MVHKLLHYQPLYRWFHATHHKSYNPGPWSGLSMHPVEHLIFFTSCCLPLFYELHPIHMLFPCLYARISPIAGHDGFDKPAGGSYVHYLHHSKFTGESLPDLTSSVLARHDSADDGLMGLWVRSEFRHPCGAARSCARLSFRQGRARGAAARWGVRQDMGGELVVDQPRGRSCRPAGCVISGGEGG